MPDLAASPAPGVCRLVGALASLVGVGLFNFKLKHMPLR